MDSLATVAAVVGEPALQEAWSLHCESLHSCSHGEAVVADLHAQFAELLSSAPLRSVNTPGKKHARVFDVDLRSPLLDQQTALATVQMPQTVLPIIEFLRCVVDLAQRLLQQQEAAAALRPSSSSSSSGSPAAPALSPGKSLSPLRCRAVVKGAPQSPYSALGAASLGLLLSVTGTVVRMASPAVVCTHMPFRCVSCGHITTVQVNGPLEFPARCEAARCKGFQFTPITAEAVCSEMQMVKLQEAAQSLDVEASNSSNKMIEVELSESLMDTVVAGDVVVVCGVLSTRRAPSATRFGGSAHQTCVIKARSVESSTLLPSAMSVHDAADQSFDAGQFFEMAQHPRWFDHLVSALAPSIYGHELVKTALVLALLGGCDRPHMRGAIHLVMMGDPGLGKSQLLRAACSASPRGVFVCANTSSSCGLTVTLARDPNSGETTFEAGAVVHGDGGVTCIDEIDKGAPREHESLLEVMEQQTVSIAKAGMVFSMPIKSTILAAGNPKSGRFNPRESIVDNVGLNSALLSRFDFAILLKDTPRCERGVTNHVLDMHVTGSGYQQQQQQPRGAVGGGGSLDASTLTKYIAVARRVCHPVLSMEAALLLQDAYLQERARQTALSGELPVTPRQLQALIRITEARARAELKPVATKDHARFAIDLQRQIREVFLAETAPYAGVRQLPGGKKKDQKGEVLDRLRLMMNESNRVVLAHDEIIQVCEEVGVKNAEALLKGLHDNGHLLSAVGGKYKLAR